MAKTITFGIQKGGSSKSTSSSITAWLLSQNPDHRVLAVDLDSQGNMTELLSGKDDIYEFTGRTVLEAMKDLYATGEEICEKYIQKLTDRLHLLPAEDFMATFSRWIYTELGRISPRQNPGLILKNTLDKISDYYTHIIIDTPPALSDATINGLAAADAVVAMFEPSKFNFSALPRFFETIEHIQDKLNSNLKIAGILATIIDSRRTDSKVLLDLIKEEYEGLLFQTIINRKAATGRIAIFGFGPNNKELEGAVESYRSFVKELLQRV